jgi:hypothetical protein
VLSPSKPCIVGIDACLPADVAADMFFTASAAPAPARQWPRRPYECAVELAGKNAEMVQLEAGDARVDVAGAEHRRDCGSRSPDVASAFDYLNPTT